MSRHELFQKYLENADAYVNWGKLTNGEDPDEEFMRSIEIFSGISDASKKFFREDVMIQLSRHLRKGWEFTWESVPQIKNALEIIVATETSPLLGEKGEGQ